MRPKATKVITLILLAAVLIGAIVFGVDYAEKKWVYPIKYSEYVEEYSRLYSVDEALVYAVINCESGFDAEALSPAGAIGLMQITPETFRWLQTKDDTVIEFDDETLYDARTNIKYGVLLLSLNLQEFGNTRTALASYNAGRGKVSEWLADERYSGDSRTLTQIPYAETENYVERVCKHMQKYSKRLEKE